MPPSYQENRARSLLVHPVIRPARGVHTNRSFGQWHMQTVRVIGRPLRMEVEQSARPESVDHFWITLSVAEVGPVLLSVNTSSLRNRRAGFDDRIRVGRVKVPYHRVPTGGMSRSRLLNYRTIEENANVFYEYYDRPELENLLGELTKSATWVQAWGVAFARRTLGVHQIHSRRASCAVAEDLVGMDGALRFYRAEQGVAELLLLKFCGQ